MPDFQAPVQVPTVEFTVPEREPVVAEFETPEREPVDFSISFHSDMVLGTVETLPAGSQAYIVNVGTARNQIWNIGIPKGDQGQAGKDATINGYNVAEIVAGEGIDVQTTAGVIQITNTQTSAEWGNITGDIQDQQDLQDEFATKQDTLIAGDNITIVDNVISASGGISEVDGGSAGSVYLIPQQIFDCGGAEGE